MSGVVPSHGRRAAPLLASIVVLFVATALYAAGCGLEVDGTSSDESDAAATDSFVPPTPDASLDAAGDAEPRTCSDGFQDTDETDVDCGGMVCAKRCELNQRCLVGSDCTTKNCNMATHVCDAPSCTDGAKNGTETDVDCGGSCATKCDVGKGCALGPDCTSGVCTNKVCAAPTCSDGVKNGTETDKDCGGSCPACGLQKGCKVNGDCQSGHCANMVCVDAACTDNIKDGTETDVDCGGPSCAPCGNNKSCLVANDCQSHVCTGMQCKAPTCTDGVKNGTETDVDCGGGSCAGCAANKACLLGSDCASGVCNANVCQPPTCNDGVKNGTETDVDCGGTCATKCGYQQGCAINGDCRGGVCTAMHCAATCSDGVKNGTESDVDCGGSCAACADGKLCNVQGDCGNMSFCNGTGRCAPKQILGTTCGANNNCQSGNCVDATCCNVPQSMCNGCKACNLGGGMCANVPAGQDPHSVCVANVANCKGNRCAGDGTCNVPDNTACAAPTCSVATQTNHVCVGGSCTSPTVMCSPYVCSGTTCASSCTSDTGCAATHYCDQNGTCQLRKTGGAACNTTSDCKVGGCRECDSSTAGCFDGFCCNAACGGNCQACSIAAGGAANGTCSALTGTTGRAGVCSPLVCGGGPGCPGSCANDNDCIAGHYCTSAGTCMPSKGVGGTCNLVADCKVSGCRECGTSPCVDGFCCSAACSGACQACSVAQGASADGTCTNVTNKPGRPSCSPYLCNGMSPNCPTSCTSDDPNCAMNAYCKTGGVCALQKNLGAPCGPSGDCNMTGCRECSASCSPVTNLCL